mmetsp:Transcript_20697/g.36794  ORF Transcript_20697/g.36794 Transcript_20697/m.36794 type:complete len:327 (-) Transcript_20697:169-1149(-)|eukprot:CAMPEP_0197528854 /NCGR_PEP_ID=MMETSP1318-20131121/26552_1 /TAXON_ID=552666 /ORGANISM="Partenskyella glossopodia, Strain RCC365" /LENGTH=326 /DNA_ID=CAMNT_0043084121 /DNA_START=119 /DNA_END=1099 /DNA_ORIENTATION=+
MAASVCNLFSNLWAIFLQGLLAVAVFSLLIVKWRCERPMRQFRVWIFDALKQCVSAAFQHLCNVLIATIARYQGGKGDEECGWYMISFTIDAVLGTSLSLILLKYVLEPIAKKCEFEPLVESGDYGQPDNINVRWWAIQLFSWVSINILARVICGGLVFGLHQPLLPFVQWLTHLFKGEAILYLVIAMIGTPTSLNILQLIIQDTCLMKSNRQDPTILREDDARHPNNFDKLPLMDVSDGDAGAPEAGGAAPNSKPKSSSAGTGLGTATYHRVAALDPSGIAVSTINNEAGGGTNYLEQPEHFGGSYSEEVGAPLAGGGSGEAERY